MGANPGRAGARWPRQAAAVAVAALAACTPRPRIGVVLPESGAASVYGASIHTGITLAIDQARMLGGRTVEVEYRDSGSEPTRAASAAEALFEHGALLVIGGVTSAEARAMIPVAERWNRVLLSPSASEPALGRGGRTFFRVYPSDEVEGVAAARLAASGAVTAEVLILEQDNEYTRGLLPVFVDELQRRGGRVLNSLRLDDAGWEPALHASLAAHLPTAVYVCGYGEAIVAGVRALRAASFPGVVFTTSAITTASLLERAGATLEGVVVPLVPFDPAAQNEPVRGFVAHYRTIYNLQPDIFAAHGYDAALVALEALAAGRTTDGSDLAERMREPGHLHGTTGPLAFDDRGNVRRTLLAHWVHRGRVEPWPLAALGARR